MTVINTKIVKIGNSQGIRIPKVLLEQVDLGEVVELLVQDDMLVIRAAQKPRQGWEEAFARMADQGGDALLDEAGQIEHDWDAEGWEW